MCGIVGFIGEQEAAPILLEGLARMEYRGYDSAGLALLDPVKGLQVAKAKGRLSVLSEKVDGGKKLFGTIGVGHTRWATHGEPSDVNSHPLLSDSGRIAVVHNGIIENYMEIKEFLQERGVLFHSDTDTEVVAQLLDYYYQGDILDAVQKVLHRIEGSYGLGIVCAEHPEQLIAARKDSPLVLGYGDGFNMMASDVTALIKYTRDVSYMENGEIAVLTRQGIQVYNILLEPVEKEHSHGGLGHFRMRKRVVMSTLCSRRSWSSPKPSARPSPPASRTAGWCWTISTLTCRLCEEHHQILHHCLRFLVSRGHGGQVCPGKDRCASRWRWRWPPSSAIATPSWTKTPWSSSSASPARRWTPWKPSGKPSGWAGAPWPSSTWWAAPSPRRRMMSSTPGPGPEIAVATTKAYSTQLAVLDLLCLYLADLLGSISAEEYTEILTELTRIPDKLKEVLEQKERIQQYASQFFNHDSIFFIGRNLDYAIGLESVPEAEGDLLHPLRSLRSR